MASTGLKPGPVTPTPIAPRATDVEAREMVPIKWWAGVGAAFMAFIVYLVIAWFASGDATPTDPGPDPVPDFMHISGIVIQIVGPIVALTLVYYFVIRPWRREGRVPFDGLFLLGFAAIYWQDPLVNYTLAWCNYNSDLVNLGSWTEQVPGWQSPNGSLFPEPILFSGFGYMYSLFAGALCACWAMRKAKARWPRIGNFGLFMVCWGFLAVFDLFMEVGFMRLGLYTYGGSIPELSISAGHYYQFPVYEAVLWGGIWAVWASLRYFRDDKGRSIAERGIDQLKVGNRTKGAMRFLAIAGVMNLSLLLLYTVPWQLIAIRSGPWNEDTTSRSYLMGGLCGPGTAYACADPLLPLNRKGAGRITPDLQFVPKSN